MTVTATSTQKPAPSKMIEIMNQISESMFGQTWKSMVKKAEKDMADLVDITIISKRDRYIFVTALHLGIKYGVAYSRALRNAQKPLNIIKKFFTRKPRK